MGRSLGLMLCASLLAPLPALAQEDEPVVEVVPVEEAAAEPAEPAGGAVVEEMAAEPAEEETDVTGSFVDVFYVPTTVLEIPGVLDENGDGIGGRGLYRFGRHFAASGEYHWRRYEKADIELSERRLGFGLVAKNDSGDLGGLFLEYQQLESDLDDIDGFGVHGRLSHAPYEWLRFHGDLGYLWLEGDAEKYGGFEFTAGLVFSIGRNGLFVDWRRTVLEGKDSGVGPTVQDVRVGARLTFGG